MALGGTSIDWFKSEFSQLTIVLLYLWKNVGYNMILFMAALAGIPKDITEAAALDGASGLQTFFRIKVPYLSSTILFVTILSVINSFKVFREVYLLTGDYPYDSLYLLQHFMNNMFKSLDYQKLSSAAILMGIVMVLIIGLLFWIDRKLGKDIEE
jgi:multiple sugar transport system permease protein